jgi:hypothetical protein
VASGVAGTPDIKENPNWFCGAMRHNVGNELWGQRLTTLDSHSKRPRSSDITFAYATVGGDFVILDPQRTLLGIFRNLVGRKVL